MNVLSLVFISSVVNSEISETLLQSFRKFLTTMQLSNTEKKPNIS